jgi:hypothetical protein
MASLALMNRIQGSNTADAGNDALLEAGDERFSVRSIPAEEMYLFVKEIDNSRVVREADPKASGAAWRLILTAGMIVALLVAVLLPSAYGRIAGYRIENLRAERARLLTEKSALEVEEQALLSPERLQYLAEQQRLVDPGPQNFVYLDGKTGAIAMNK